MTRIDSQVIQCPHCENKQDVTIWHSVNVSLNPDLKKKLFDWEINTLSCNKCDKKVFLDTPLLYHDMTQKFCVQYYPSEMLKDPSFFLLFDADGCLKMESTRKIFELGEDYVRKPHIVFDMTEMLRYILFRDQINEEGQKQDN